MRALEVFPPAAYDGSWLWLAIAALTFVLVAPAVGWWLTRPEPVPPPPPPPPPDPDAGRRAALAALSGVRTALAQGSITPKRASQELSRIVREFTGERTGLDLEAMTLLELRADARLAPVADLVGGLYEPAFSRPGGDEVRAITQLDRSAQRAAQLVTEWH